MIFISYSRKDEKIARKIKDLLEKEFGSDVLFFDQDNIKPGENFLKKISKEIDKAKIFVPIFTKNYFESQICTIEFDSFYLSSLSNTFKKIIPFYPEEIWDDVPSIYKLINCIIENKEKLKDAIKKIIDGKKPVLRSFLENKFQISKIYSDLIEIEFVDYNQDIISPVINIKFKNSPLEILEPIRSEWEYPIEIWSLQGHQRMSTKGWSAIFSQTFIKGNKVNIAIKPKFKNNLYDMQNFLHSISSIEITNSQEIINKIDYIEMIYMISQKNIIQKTII